MNQGVPVRVWQKGIGRRKKTNKSQKDGWCVMIAREGRLRVEKVAESDSEITQRFKKKR